MRRKARLLKGYLQGNPIWCSWQVTRRCGELCQFCDHRSESAETELDLDGCRQVSEELARLGSLVVSLTGGEPFLRSDLAEIVGLIARHHFPLLTTDGWLVTPERARAVWSAGLLAASVSFHHAESARHDTVAGVQGSHARALQALETLVRERTAPGQSVNLKLRLAHADAEPVEALARLAARHQATLTVEPAYPVAQGGHAPGLSGALLELKRRHSQLRSSRFFLGEIGRALGDGVPGCRAGRAFLNIDHRGRVSKCIEFQGPADRAGDLAAEGVRHVLPRLKRLHRENDCRSCWYASRGEVEGLYRLRGLAGVLPLLVRA